MVSRNLVWSGFLSLGVLLFCTTAQAQRALRNDDVAVGGIFQFTTTASGNGITDTPTKSVGGEAAFRHSFHWYMGYEVAYDYTRFGENYTGQQFGYQHNVHQFSGSYYVHGPRALGLQPFALAGISAVVFSPSLNGGQNVPFQAKPGADFGAGVNLPLVTSYFGVRVQYRGVYYKAPDFGLAKLRTDSWRLTSEPMVGIYIRF